MSEKRGMVIHFVDGSSKTLEFPEQQKDEQVRMQRIKQALEARHLVVEADGALVIFPFENIKYLQVYPAPKKLPENAIKGASFKG